ncbi:hypothetical protein [Lentibacillus saliphilus]|uniref:hypothetical protein n=1 Tax=Lentibacillus saliphilus TaxID=2737028 RepID=UPI001C302008|nr:hypothetical protein [Lentibacillus saliphilus]
MEQTFYKEMEEYKIRASNIEKQIKDLKREKAKLEKSLVEAGTEYTNILADEAKTGEKAEKVKLNQLQKKKESLQKSIAQYDERISLIESSKKESLQELIPSLHDGYKRELDLLNKKIEVMKKNILPQAAKYLNYLKLVGEVNKRADLLHEDFMREAKKATDELDNKYRFGRNKVDLKIYNTPNESEWQYGVIMGSRNGMKHWDDQDNALQRGTLPPQVELYNLTGEVEPVETEARRKIHKAQQEERKKSKWLRD